MWENKDAALADITAGLRRIIAEELPQLTASAPRAALPPIWNIAYRFHQDYQAVLCARAESAKTIVSSYVAIASLLQLPEREAKE